MSKDVHERERSGLLPSKDARGRGSRLRRPTSRRACGTGNSRLDGAPDASKHLADGLARPDPLPDVTRVVRNSTGFAGRYAASVTSASAIGLARSKVVFTLGTLLDV